MYCREKPFVKDNFGIKIPDSSRQHGIGVGRLNPSLNGNKYPAIGQLKDDIIFIL